MEQELQAVVLNGEELMWALMVLLYNPRECAKTSLAIVIALSILISNIDYNLSTKFWKGLDLSNKVLSCVNHLTFFNRTALFVNGL